MNYLKFVVLNFFVFLTQNYKFGLLIPSNESVLYY